MVYTESQRKACKKYYDKNRKERCEESNRLYFKNHEQNIKKQRIYRKKNKEHIREYNKKYRLEHKEKEKQTNKNYKLKNKYKVRAHNLVGTKRRNGTIKKEPCVFCSEKPTVAHHENYEKPFEITWVCQSCHMRIHSGSLKVYNNEGGGSTSTEKI